MATSDQPRVAKHLMDPANLPRRQRPEERARELQSLNRVRQWVMSVLLVTTLFHLAVGLVIAALFTDHDRVDARVGLNVIAAILLTAAIGAARVIHKKSPVSAWLLLGLVPSAVGLYLVLR
ncbi:MAG TPA: hypothetical protein VHZ06_05315 [Marmoricola sp.]|jgi:uncharacterized membrane protein YfcA|nr:hypothetical protein [Marmoricola sp.]